MLIFTPSAEPPVQQMAEQIQSAGVTLEFLLSLTWYQVIGLAGLLLAPGVIAIILTLILITVIKRYYIEEKMHMPMSEHLMFMGIGGAACGFVSLYSLDRLVYRWLLGIPELPELYIFAIFVTPLAAMGARGILIKHNWKGLGELLDVENHYKPSGGKK